jgi:hypothetical protein
MDNTQNQTQTRPQYPQYQKELNGESEKITVLHLENFYFRPNTVLRKTTLNLINLGKKMSALRESAHFS